MARANGETIWWSLFAAGGVVAALVLPALILVTGIALPFVNIGAFPDLKTPSYGALFNMAFSILGRLVLFVTLSLAMIHCAHRIVHTSKDIGLHAIHVPIAYLFYGAALVGAGFAFWVIWL
jgi:fumarate reductase subunit D